MRGRIQVWNKLHVITQRIVGELLQFCARQRERVNDRRSGLVLEVPFKLDSKSIDFKGCRLPHSVLQDVKALQVMGVIPINDTQLNIRPIDYLPFRKPEATLSTPDQLKKSLHAIKKSRSGTGCDLYAFRTESQAVCLCSNRSTVSVGGLSD